MRRWLPNGCSITIAIMDGLLIFRCGNEMLLNKNLCVSALFMLLMTVNACAVSARTDSNREICLAVAKRQALMYDAKINSDWPAIYGLLTEELRSQTSYEDG